MPEAKKKPSAQHLFFVHKRIAQWAKENEFSEQGNSISRAIADAEATPDISYGGPLADAVRQIAEARLPVLAAHLHETLDACAAIAEKSEALPAEIVQYMRTVHVWAKERAPSPQDSINNLGKYLTWHESPPVKPETSYPVKSVSRRTKPVRSKPTNYSDYVMQAMDELEDQRDDRGPRAK